MKNCLFFILSVAMYLLAACNNDATGTSNKNYPAPGTKLAEAEMPVADPLNKFIFGVRLSADSLVKDGVYDVQAIYGYDTANGKFTMPKGLENYKLLIRKSDELYTYIIGFQITKDTTFYDYFQVTGGKHTIDMKYIKGYTFQ